MTSEDIPQSTKKNWPAIITFIIILLSAVYAIVHSQMYLKIDNARVTADMVTVRSEVEGRIIQSNIDLRSKQVGQGTLIVSLEAANKNKEIDIIKASILEIESQIKYNTHAYQVAIAQIDDTQHKYEMEKGILDKELQRLQIESDQLGKIRQKTQELFNQNLVATNVLDKAVSDHQMADLQVAKQKANINKHIITLNQLKTERKKAQLLTHKINADKKRLLKTQNQVQLLEIELRKLAQHAPIDGVVDQVFVNNGEYVTEGQRLFMMHSQNSIKIEANILETDLNKVQLGDEVDVILDYMPNKTLHGTISRIASVTNDQLALIPTTQMASDFVKIKQRLVMDIQVKLEGEHIAPGMMATVIIPI